MAKIVHDEEYLNTSEVMKEFGASKKHFYDKIRPQLRVYRFDARQTPWYKTSEVQLLKDGKPIRKASLTLSGGIQRDWTKYLLSLGYSAQTENNEVKIVTLSDEVIETFGLVPGKQYVQRKRTTRVDRVPICTWSTYYPVDLVANVLDQIRTGHVSHIVEHIKDTHGVVVGYSKERYTARITTFDEEAYFQLRSQEAILTLQRVSYTADRKTLVLYSDMTLLGSWFAPEHEYETDTWQK